MNSKIALILLWLGTVVLDATCASLLKQCSRELPPTLFAACCAISYSSISLLVFGSLKLIPSRYRLPLKTAVTTSLAWPIISLMLSAPVLDLVLDPIIKLLISPFKERTSKISETMKRWWARS